MPDYRRAYVPGGTFFLTIVTYQRQPIFSDRENVARLRQAITDVMREAPFRIPAAVVLPDHLHLLCSLPRGDSDYSRRVGRMKVLFTRSLSAHGVIPDQISRSRLKHRESGIWQRRFWEHWVEDETDFENLLNYIHYNPVRHGLVTCPHLWPFSSFRKWVGTGFHPEHWGCCCDGRKPVLPLIAEYDEITGE